MEPRAERSGVCPSAVDPAPRLRPVVPESRPHSLAELVRLGTMTDQCARFLKASVVASPKIVTAGATRPASHSAQDCRMASAGRACFARLDSNSWLQTGAIARLRRTGVLQNLTIPRVRGITSVAAVLVPLGPPRQGGHSDRR